VIRANGTATWCRLDLRWVYSELLNGIARPAGRGLSVTGVVIWWRKRKARAEGSAQAA